MSENLTSRSVNLAFRGVSFDYLLETDQYGWVHHISTPFFDLPDSAQRLMLGDTEGVGPEQIRALGAGVQPALLYLLAGNTLESLPYSALEPLAKEIEDELRNTGEKWAKPSSKHSRPPGFMWYHKLLTFRGGPPEKDTRARFTIALGQLLNFEERNKSVKLYEGIRYFGYYGNLSGSRLIIEMEALFHDNARRLALENLHYHKSDEIRAYLLDRIEEPGNQHYASGALKALRAYHDAEVKEKTIRFYRNNEDITEDALYNICDVLQDFPGQESVAVILEILGMCKRHSSGGASRALRKLKYPQEKIVEELKPKLMSSVPNEQEGAFAILLQVDPAYFPDGNFIWDAFLSSMKRTGNANIVYSMPTLLRVKKVDDFAQKVWDALNNPTPSVSTSTLTVISFEDVRKAQGYEIDARTGHLLWDQLEHGHDMLKKEVIKKLHLIPATVLPEDFLIRLSDLYTATGLNNILTLHIMEAVGNWIEKKNISCPRAWEKLALEAIEIKNYNYPVAALRLLHLCDSQEAQAAIAKAKESTIKDVERAANRKPQQALGMDVNVLQSIIKDENALLTFRKELERRRKQSQLPSVGSDRKDGNSEDTGLLARLSRWFKS